MIEELAVRQELTIRMAMVQTENGPAMASECMGRMVNGAESRVMTKKEMVEMCLAFVQNEFAGLLQRSGEDTPQSRILVASGPIGKA